MVNDWVGPGHRVGSGHRSEILTRIHLWLVSNPLTTSVFQVNLFFTIQLHSININRLFWRCSSLPVFTALCLFLCAVYTSKLQAYKFLTLTTDKIRSSDVCIKKYFWRLLKVLLLLLFIKQHCQSVCHIVISLIWKTLLITHLQTAMCSRAWRALCAVGSRFNLSRDPGKARPPTWK